jgi:hypothetical protein
MVLLTEEVPTRFTRCQHGDIHLMGGIRRVIIAQALF